MAGFTVGVTADRRADEQIKLLESRGAACLHGPVIKTHPLGPSGRRDAPGELDGITVATEALIGAPPDLVVLTTGLGVRGWLEAADAADFGDGLRRLFAATDLYARGPKAVGAVVTAGFDVAWSAPTARYADITAALGERGVAGARVAVQLDGAGAEGLCASIRELGAEVVGVPVYRWSLPADTSAGARLVGAVADRRLDAVTFTAKPAVENFWEIAAEIEAVDAVAAALNDGSVAAFCVGPVCAAGFDDTPVDTVHHPDRHRLGAMVQQITDHFAARAAEIVLAGTPVRVQGRLAFVGADATWLTARERALLAVLLEQPGVVWSKRDLLRRVWGGEGDEHLVEVTVGRLRRRLGPAAAGIETVMRRGYRASAGNTPHSQA